jgi:hypothetical protein
MAILQERCLRYLSRAGLEPGTSGFSTLHINHYATRGTKQLSCWRSTTVLRWRRYFMFPGCSSMSQCHSKARHFEASNKFECTCWVAILTLSWFTRRTVHLWELCTSQPLLLRAVADCLKIIQCRAFIIGSLVCANKETATPPTPPSTTCIKMYSVKVVHADKFTGN